ncbi:MAG TPA: DoxX family protein, partial [Alphaproteobacteria bacterium]|nr:DoxX family protein [Alphaproteobacteria bacterium]
MIKKILAPGNDPALTSFSLLVLRLWLGLTMFFYHGLDKLRNFNDVAAHFPNPIGIGAKPGLVLVIMAEVLGAWLLALGLLTRLGALMLAIDMGVAFFMFHQMALGMVPKSGELAFIYLAGFVTLFLAGPGKFS